MPDTSFLGLNDDQHKGALIGSAITGIIAAAMGRNPLDGIRRGIAGGLGAYSNGVLGMSKMNQDQVDRDNEQQKIQQALTVGGLQNTQMQQAIDNTNSENTWAKGVTQNPAFADIVGQKPAALMAGAPGAVAAKFLPEMLKHDPSAATPFEIVQGKDGKLYRSDKRTGATEDLNMGNPAPASEATGAAQDERYRQLTADNSTGVPLAPKDKAWVAAYEKQKTLGPNATAAARIQIANDIPINAYDTNTGGTYFVTRQDLLSNPGRYVGAELGSKIKSKLATFNEINNASAQARAALNGLKTDFDTTQAAQFAEMLKSDDRKSAIKNFFSGAVGRTLTPDQKTYIAAVNNLRESSYALRTMSGMGQGSDTLRAAIESATLNAATPDRGYANHALDMFDNQVALLKAGVSGLGGEGVAPRSKKKGGIQSPSAKGLGSLSDAELLKRLGQ